MTWCAATIPTHTLVQGRSKRVVCCESKPATKSVANQANRDSLEVDGRHRFVWMLIVITFPVSYPIAKLLDLILGEDHGTFFRRSGMVSYCFFFFFLSMLRMVCDLWGVALWLLMRIWICLY
jgi:hypothetical protein